MSEFGEEVRRLLAEHGISLREAARRSHFDASYLSKVINGRKPGTRDLAAALDDVLGASGALTALADGVRTAADAPDDQSPLSVLLPLSFLREPGSRPALTVDGAESVLVRLYRIDAELGGNELCAVVTGYLQDAARMFAQAPSHAGAERLHQVMGGLTQMAGWLSIDASRHGDARRYLAATIYAAHEAGDLGLAGHALGYLSLSALYRDRLGEALSLAETAISLTRGASPATRAVVRTRAARALARDGSLEECRRQLDLADADFADGTAREPQWCRYVDRIELAAQRGACFLDLKMPKAAIGPLAEAISLIGSGAPGRVRDLAHYSTRMALAHLRSGNLDEAVSVAGQAHALTGQVSSARVSERFGELVAAIGGCDAPQAREFAESVRAAG